MTEDVVLGVVAPIVLFVVAPIVIGRLGGPNRPTGR